jgi:hypothetical protein
MLHSLESIVVVDGNHQSMEFIADRFGCLSLSPNRKDSSDVFVGMVHSRSPSLHTILEESTDEGNIASSRGGSSGFPIS